MSLEETRVGGSKFRASREEGCGTSGPPCPTLQEGACVSGSVALGALVYMCEAGDGTICPWACLCADSSGWVSKFVGNYPLFSTSGYVTRDRSST